IRNPASLQCSPCSRSRAAPRSFPHFRHLLPRMPERPALHWMQQVAAGLRDCPTSGRARAARLPRGLLLGRINDLDAAVLLPAVLAVVLADRTLFAVADGVELAGRGAGGAERAADRVAAALAEAEVVLARAALVGVAFERHARARELVQILGVAGDLRLELRPDL